MPSYGAYYDASGKQTDGPLPLVVAGAAATEGKWRKFERDWTEALRYFQVPYFHSKEFAHSVGAFATWKGDEPRRQEFVKHLLIALKRNIHKFFVSQVTQADFNAVNEHYALAEVAKNPYTVAAGNCVALVHDWVRKKHGASPVRHVVESGDAGQGVFKLVMQTEGIPVTTTPKVDVVGKHVLPFQASDLVAYEFHHAAVSAAQRSPRPFRYPLKVIGSHIPVLYGIHDAGSLTRACAAHPDVFKPRQR